MGELEELEELESVGVWHAPTPPLPRGISDVPRGPAGYASHPLTPESLLRRLRATYKTGALNADDPLDSRPGDSDVRRWVEAVTLDALRDARGAGRETRRAVRALYVLGCLTLDDQGIVRLTRTDRNRERAHHGK